MYLHTAFHGQPSSGKASLIAIVSSLTSLIRSTSGTDRSVNEVVDCSGAESSRAAHLRRSHMCDGLAAS